MNRREPEGSRRKSPTVLLETGAIGFYYLDLDLFNLYHFLFICCDDDNVFYFFQECRKYNSITDTTSISK